ncbi:unnamed protein product [Effrenium voratum]|uniref:Uncharacterized protein n=1 Tax=Effrenium voratum TaxID=2562239 RepID=A0AA36JB13_9DINO|nr:unnamed protein product [Effrenium voratum]
MHEGVTSRGLAPNSLSACVLDLSLCFQLLFSSMCLCLLGIALALLVQPSTDFARGVPGLKDSILAKRHPLHAGVARRAGAAQEDNSGQDWRDLEEAADQRMRAEFVEEDLLLARQQLQFALEEQETAQAQVATAQEQVATAQEQVATAQEQEAIAVRRLARAEESGDAKKVQAAERKVQAAERKVQVAERKVERAKKEVQEAERKVEKAERKVERAKKEVKEAKASGRTKESEAGGVGRFRRPAAFWDSDRCVRF